MEFIYSIKELEYLKSKSTKIKYIIDKIGYIKRECDEDIFSSVFHHIIGQQISMSAQASIYRKLKDNIKDINPITIYKTEDSILKSCGISDRKISYIKDFAGKIINKEFDINKIKNMPDEEAISYLSSLKGIGRWTAEMILLFSLQRKNVFAYDDLAIQRGLMMIFHHRKITKKLFEKYKRMFSPYCSVLSFYVWHIANKKCKDIKLDKNGYVIYEY